MSAHLFDFHRGGDEVERMNDGKKGKLTLLNPMRNVGLAVSVFFFLMQCHINHKMSFQLLLTALQATSVIEIDHSLNSAKCVRHGSFCSVPQTSLLEGAMVINDDNTGSSFSIP